MTDSDDTARKAQAITAIADSVIDEYLADRNVIFRDDRERSKYLFGALDDTSRIWKRSKKCMVPGCTNKSIARSHAVPRGMLSARVGEAGHVLTPGRDRIKDGQLVLQRVGLALASTFPGFCESHELLFQSFENAKKVASESDLLLQAYRTACRELFRTRFWIGRTTELFRTFKALRDERLLERLKQRLDAAGLGTAQINNLEVKDDPMVASWDRPLAALRELNVFLETKLVPALEAAVFGSDESGLHVWAVDIDTELPVGLSGAATVPMRVAGHGTQLHFVMAVLPHDGGTLVCIVGAAEDQVGLTAYQTRWMQNGLEFLSMIESWMINGSDQWFLRPSVWDKLGSKRQELVLQEISECARNVYEEADQSIFDDVRRSVLAMFEAANAGRSDAGNMEFVKKHRAKCGLT